MKIINHHIRYKEIDKYDLLIPMEYGVHQELHELLHELGFPKIPEKISYKAYKRTEKGKITTTKYNKEYYQRRKNETC